MSGKYSASISYIFQCIFIISCLLLCGTIINMIFYLIKPHDYSEYLLPILYFTTFGVVYWFNRKIYAYFSLKHKAFLLAVLFFLGLVILAGTKLLK